MIAKVIFFLGVECGPCAATCHHVYLSFVTCCAVHHRWTFFSLLSKTLAMIEKARAFEFDAVLPLW
jgi:hypothetical protein